MFDRYQREIHYLRLSVTDLCNLRCRYCMPDGVEKLEREAVLTYEEFLRLAALFAQDAQALALAQELVALVGQGHALGVAVEQADADFLLQAADLLRHRRRRQVQATCGLGHRSRIDGEQVSAQEGGLHEDGFPFFLLYESAVYLACLPGDTASIVIPQEALPC